MEIFMEHASTGQDYDVFMETGKALVNRRYSLPLQYVNLKCLWNLWDGGLL